jgi:hypothetical protein
MRNASRNEEVPVFWKPTPTIKGEEARAMPAKVAFGLTSEGHPPRDVNDLRTQVEVRVDENAELTAMINPYAMKRFCSLWASALLMAGAWAQTSVVTFNLNMENENVSSAGVFLGGGVMGDATAYQLTDPDGDDVYSVDVVLPNGTTGNYIFLNGNCPDFSCKENIAGQPCSDPTNFDDRTLPIVTGDMTLSTCFGECSSDGTCGPPPASAVVTFEVNMVNEDVSPDGVYLGGGVIGGPTQHQLMDPDGDGMYSVDVTLPLGLTGNYIFLNGNCPDWLCKENISGLPCSDPNNWDDRTLPAITEDMTISTCFGTCSEDGYCVPPPPSADVTFRVDMNEYPGAYGTVNLNGSFNGWCGPCVTMTDDNGDGVYEYTQELEQGLVYEYKFTVDGWTDQEMFDEGMSCTSTIDGFTNRTLEVTEDVVLPEVCWAACGVCNAEPVPGCTDAVACNFDPNATEDDGSCVFGEGPVLGYSVEDALCFGEAGVLSLDKATMALLDDGLIAVEVVGAGETLTAGDYVLVATDLQGCTSETPFTVGEPDALEVEVTIVSEDTGAGDGQAEATVVGGTPYYVVVWNDMNGIEVNPDSLSVGLYTAIVTDANGCTTSASLTMTVSGIDDVAALQGAVFPVPVVDQLNVQLAAPLLGEATLTVRDMQGRLVASTAMRPSQQHAVLFAAAWEAGVYTVQIATEGARATWSFVK